MPSGAATFTAPGSIPNAASDITSVSSKPPATRSPPNQQRPDLPRNLTRLRCAPPGPATRLITLRFSDQAFSAHLNNWDDAPRRAAGPSLSDRDTPVVT